MRSFFVTGGAGFIGSNFVRHLLQTRPGARVTNFDALTYAGVPATVSELDQLAGHRFVRGDIRDSADVLDAMAGHDVVVHFAAESHVDRSIDGQQSFLETNVLGTGVLLDAARNAGVGKFVHVSTDEVYGSIDSGFAVETDLLDPSSPYSASKAGSDLLVLAHARTYGLPVIITRCTNNFGPYQYPEKLIPLFVTNLLKGKPVPLYGDGRNQRDWLHVSDHCRALSLLIDEGTEGEVYNIGANSQVSNIELARLIVGLLGRDESMIEFVQDRPGHDFRYAVNSDKLRGLGWAPSEGLEQRLAETVEWYRARSDWWAPLVSP